MSMVKSERSKRLKASIDSGRGIDRISNLPEPLISHILSLLPTKCALATSVLSTRWKLLWTSITNLDLRSEEVLCNWPATHESKKTLELKRNKFTNFVNRVLLLLNPPSVHNFRLSCYQDCFDHSYLNSWISVGFGRTVREFELSLNLKNPVELPLSHIYCNVSVIKLYGNIDFNISAAASVCLPSLQALHLVGVASVIASNSCVSFPNLKVMHLSYVKFEDEDSAHKLFSSCPVLDELIIEREDRDIIDCLVIRIPSLTRLTIDFKTFGYDRMYKLQIDSPALQYLYLNDEVPCEYLPAENLFSLLQAKVNMNFPRGVDVNVETCTSIIKFIGTLSKAKFLSLSGHVLEACRIASANIPAGFHNLTRLKLELYNCINLSLVIKNLLENMDNLEHLVMQGSLYPCSHQSWWSEPLNVPKCLLSRVTTISFSCMDIDCDDQLELVRYFLKNAEVLQLLEIGTNHITERKELQLVKKISLVPRGSRTCEVAFNRMAFLEF